MSVNISGMMKSIRNIMREDTGLNGDAQRIEQLGWMIFIKILSDKEKELEVMEDDYVTPLPPEYHWDEGITSSAGKVGYDLNRSLSFIT